MVNIKRDGSPNKESKVGRDNAFEDSAWLKNCWRPGYNKMSRGKIRHSGQRLELWNWKYGSFAVIFINNIVNMILGVRCWDREKDNIFKEDFKERLGYNVGRSPA